MDRSKKKDDKQSLYEIYRACRLCGAGGGYKMPIIQNFLQIDDGEEIDLKQKIRECLQLEINLDDRMPPLICELCADKVNDFYDFLNVCKRTNKQTRMRLGLPLKITSKDSSTETCMLGLVEASALKTESEEPPSKKAKKMKINKDIDLIKNEHQKTLQKDVKEIRLKETKSLEKQKPNKEKSLKDIKTEKDIKESFEKEKGKKETQKRTTRNSLEDLVFTKVQELSKKPTQKAGPKSMLRELKELNQMIAHTEDESKLKREELNAKLKREEPNTKQKREEINSKLKKEEPKDKLKREEPKDKLKREEPKDKLKREEPNTKLKRGRDKDTKELPPPSKKTRPDPKLEKTTPPKSPTKLSPKTATLSKKVQPKVEKLAKLEKFQCPACSNIFKNNSGLVNHMIHCHPVTFTTDNLACNACREWFPTIEESVAHHKKHAHYKCLNCSKKYKNGVQYHLHIENKKCVPDNEVPDEKCSACWRLFPTKNLLSHHRCLGIEGRPGGKCSKCNRNYTLLKNLKKHESTCTFTQFMKTDEPIIDPEVKKSLFAMEVRISKCDGLLEYGPVVSACTVPHRYGLDSKRNYPYMPKLRVIKKPSFVPTPEQNTTEFGPSDLEWEDFLNTQTENTVKKLSTLSLKVLFSKNILGNKLVLDKEDYQKRLSLKRKIDSIIFKVDDSYSILEKKTVTNFENVVSGLKVSEKSDSTVYDEIASGCRSNDDASSDKITFDDLRFDNIDHSDDDQIKNDANSQNDDFVSKNDEKESQNDDSLSKNINVGAKESNVGINDEIDSQNDRSDSRNGDLSSHDDFTDETIDLASKNNDSSPKDVTCNVLNNENCKLDNNQADNHKNTLNNSNLRNKTDKINSENNENIDISKVDQNNATDVKINENNDDTDTNTVNQTDVRLDENNDTLDVNMLELDQSTINKTEEKLLNENASHNIDNITTNTLNNSKISNANSPSKIVKVVENADTVNNINDVLESSVNKSDDIELNKDFINSENETSNDNNFENHLSYSINEINDLIDAEAKDNQHPTIEQKSINISENHNNNIKEDVLNKELVGESSVQNKSNEDDFKNRDFKNDSKTGDNDLNDETEVSISKNDNDINLDSINDKIFFKTKDNNISVSNKNYDTNDSPTKKTNFSITSILKHDNSNPDNNTIESTEVDSKIDNTNVNIETRNNDSNNKNDDSTEKQNANIPDNISLTEATDDSCSTKENDKKNDKNDDSLSLSSLTFIDTSIDIDKIDKFNVNDLSEDEKRLMAEIDEQIGENNGKADFDALSENYDFNV